MKNNRQEELRKGVLAVGHERTALNEESVNRLVAYKAPEIEVIEVEVEKGFATSSGDIDDMPYWN